MPLAPTMSYKMILTGLSTRTGRAPRICCGSALAISPRVPDVVVYPGNEADVRLIVDCAVRRMV